MCEAFADTAVFLGVSCATLLSGHTKRANPNSHVAAAYSGKVATYGGPTEYTPAYIPPNNTAKRPTYISWPPDPGGKAKATGVRP